jgi:hypothetical protein
MVPQLPDMLAGGMNTRREFLLGSLSAFAVFALLREARAWTAADTGLSARRWIGRQDELARGLAAGTVTQLQWHDAVNALAREVDVAELAAELRHAQLRPAGDPFGHDPAKRFVTFIGDDGAPVRVAYGAALLSFDKASVITPHAHKHMASAHMVIAGEVRIRTFDRVADEEGALLIRPGRDEIAGPGHAAAMTTARDNIHWFAAHAERATTFDVIVDGLDGGAERYLIQPLDPLGGTHLADGTIRAPLLSFEESMKRYDASR